MRTPTPQLVMLGLAVRRCRRERDLSQEALAARAGVGAKHLGEIERGNSDPRVTTVIRIATALDLRVADLFDRIEE